MAKFAIAWVDDDGLTLKVVEAPDMPAAVREAASYLSAALIDAVDEDEQEEVDQAFKDATTAKEFTDWFADHDTSFEIIEVT